jgi:GMP synthase (glutamine-hydrolysing)
MQLKNENIEGLNILLLQIRDTETVRAEEHQSFANYAGVDKSQITILNVFDTPSFEVDVIDGFDTLFIGGASEASVLEPENYPFIESSIELIKKVIENNVPTFASCFGFQLAVLALGGKVTRDTDNYEMGTLPIQLTELAKSDDVYQGTQSGFFAVSVHQEKASELPPRSELLAYTKECVHSFKVIGSPFWAFQFHPELDKAKLIGRLSVYKEKYTSDLEHYNKIINDLQETPESNNLLKNFVQRVLLK